MTESVNLCPECGSVYVKPADGDNWAACEDCGFVQYDPNTLTLQAEVRRERAQAKAILEYVPSYQEAIAKGIIKP